MNCCGVYMGLCVASGKYYVGSSLRMSQRWEEHRAMLRGGGHYNRHLQNSWNKHGEGSFIWSVLEPCEPEVRFQREQFYLWASGRELLLNGSMVANCPECTPEILVGRSIRAKQQHAEGRLGRGTWPPGIEEEVHRKIGEARRGKTVRPESIEKMRATKKTVEWERPGRRAHQAKIAADLQSRPGFKEHLAQRTAAYWTEERRAAQAERARNQMLNRRRSSVS